MKNSRLIILIISITFGVNTKMYSQKVSEILENGIVVKNGYAVILRYENGKFKFDVGTKPSDNFDPYKNNSYFLVKGRGANTYLAPPLNPINFSIGSEITFTPDEINKNFSDAIGSIIGAISKLNPGDLKTGNNPPDPKPNKKKKDPKEIPVVEKNLIDSTCIKKFIKCKSDLTEIASLLKESKFKELNNIFKSLQSIDFTDKIVTDTGIAISKRSYASVAEYYAKITTAFEKAKSDIKEYNDCTPALSENFIYVYVLNQILADAASVFFEYNKHYKNTGSVIDLITSTVSKTIGEGKDWYLPITRVSLEDDKIGNAVVLIYDDGYSLSDDGSIVKKNKKQLEIVNLKFRKFQRFIPEVSAGIAYTKLNFIKYDVDANLVTGKKHIIESGEDKIRNMNFTTMINFNYYTPNSIIHPFWQLGIGANAGYPTLLTGVGGRINASSLKRIAVSIGLAGTWVKSLTNYKVGDEITDAAALEKDLKYQFSMPLKPYFGIQINF